LSMGLDHPNHCFAIADRAQAYMSKEEYPLAVDDWNKLYDDCPEGREDTLVDRDSTYSLMRKDELALKDSQAALGLNPDDPVVFKNRALLFMSLPRKDSALADLNRYIALRPDDPFGYNARSTILSSMGDPEGTSRDLSEARKLETTNHAHAYQKFPKAIFDGWIQWAAQR
jgi:regulator of sirC expression with transglutaminase-like and TPR domain